MVRLQSQAAAWSHYALFFLLNASRAASQGDGNPAVFIYPTKEEIYYQFDQVRVTYTSEIKTPTLHVWCRNDKGLDEPFSSIVNGPNDTYTVTINFTSEKPCWFNLKSGNDTDNRGANSKDFSVIGKKRDTGPETFGPEPQNSPPAPSDTPNNPNIDDTNNNNTNEPKSRLSTGAIAGIAVGAVLGSLAAAGGIFAYIWKRRREGKGQWTGELQDSSKYAEYGSPSVDQSRMYSDAGGSEGATGLGDKQGGRGGGVHELDTAAVRAEMPS